MKSVQHFGSVIGASLLLVARMVMADDATPSATVTVRAAPISDVESAAPTSFVNVIDAEQYAGEVETVTEALGDSVGVSVRRYGGLGAFSTVSIRGSSSNQVQIYLDGVPLSRAQNETVNLADLPIDALQRIEVYRGTAPVRFGVAGLGGVVNLVTKPPSETPLTTLSASYGSFTTRKVVVSHSQRLRGIDLLGYIAYLGSAGNFRFETDNGTPLNPNDDAEVTRLNNGFDSVAGLLKAGTDLTPEVRLDLTSETFWKETGLPGRLPAQSLLASTGDVRALNYARLRSSDWLLPRLDADATLYGIYELSTFEDPQGDLGAGRQDRHDGSLTFGGNLAPTYYLGSHQTLNSFVDVAWEQYDPDNRAPRALPEPTAERLRTTLALQDQIALWRDVVQLVPTLRYEHLSDETGGPLVSFGRSQPALSRDRDLFSPALGAEIRPREWLILRGNLGQYQRAPNFIELFGNTGSVVGNPSLESESAINRDVGFVLLPPSGGWWDGLRLEYAYFNNDIDDIIVFLPSSVAVFRPANVGKARIRGHELGLRAELLRQLRWEVNYTNQDAENRSTINGGIYTGKQLPNRPQHELYTRLAYGLGAWSIYYELNFISGNFLNLSNFDELPSRDIHTFGGSWNLFGPLSLSFQARNVTDNQISDIYAFPLPGRSFFGSLSLQL